jgi:hypothetical protein
LTVSSKSFFGESHHIRHENRRISSQLPQKS